MFYCIRNFHDTIDHYYLDHVNCFQRPVAILYKYAKPGSERFYLSYCKLYDAFNIDATHSELRDYGQQIGVQCKNIVVEDKKSFEQNIISLIREGYPVLVPGNLITIYYSEHYKTKDLGHLLIIKGYDEERQLFKIMDSSQLLDPNGYIHYHDFYIKYEDLYNFFHQFKEHYANNIFYIKKCNDQLLLSEKDRLIDLLKLIADAIRNQKYKEHEIVNWLKDGGIAVSNNSILNMFEDKSNILNIPKYKSVIFDQVRFLLKEYSYNLNNMELILNKIKNAWKTDNMIFLKHIGEGKFEHLNFRISKKTEVYEAELIQEIENSISYLQSVKAITDDGQVKFQYENNSDDIICYDQGQYIFDFNTGYTYNTWITDESPKVVFYDSKQKRKQLLFRVKCSTLIDCEKVGHQEGIFIRTNNNELYTFGLNEDKIYLFDSVGKFNIASFAGVCNSREVEIYLKKNENLFSVGIIKNEKEWIQFGQWNIDIQIIQAGVYCKTWDFCRRLKVVFHSFKTNET